MRWTPPALMLVTTKVLLERACSTKAAARGLEAGRIGATPTGDPGRMPEPVDVHSDAEANVAFGPTELDMARLNWRGSPFVAMAICKALRSGAEMLSTEELISPAACRVWTCSRRSSLCRFSAQLIQVADNVISNPSVTMMTAIQDHPSWRRFVRPSPRRALSPTSPRDPAWR